jgi:hypothetical protein
MPLAGG